VGTTVNLAVVCSGVDTEFLECEIVGVGQTGDVYPVVAKEATLATVAGYLDTEIADIKAKTDLIPASPASVSDIPTTVQIADGVLDEVIEGTLTTRKLLRIFLSVLAGISAGGGTTTITFKDAAGTTTRVTATVDANGNRTVIVLNGD
jgi:hypothetical protein